MRYTIKDITRQLSQPYHTIYFRVLSGVLPGPDVTLGKRRYYSETGRTEFLTVYKKYFDSSITIPTDEVQS